MSTLCPYRIIKGDDGLSVKVEWDVHYLTDEQLETVRSYVETLRAENEKLRELVRDMAAVICVYDQCVTVDDCPPALPMFADKMRELGVEV